MSEQHDIPKPSIDEAVVMLKGHPAFEAIVDYICDEREDMIGKFAQAINDGEAMKTAGAVAALDRIRSVFIG